MLARLIVAVSRNWKRATDGFTVDMSKALSYAWIYTVLQRSDNVNLTGLKADQGFDHSTQRKRWLNR